ncbi:Outer membrane protein TolC [Flavobacteriaceae bacterium MAR_2010_188]|nr:Outer membrane protein TolC [Flavobacteriaceae bacterium MAR_2010_188]
MMLKKLLKVFNFLILMFFAVIATAQDIDLLTVEEAVAIALENNYQIQIAKNQLEISELSISPGFAGMLPSINAVASKSNNYQNITQARSDGTIVSLDNAKNNNLNYGVELDWTIFDGLRMFARYDQLKENKRLEETQLKFQVLGTASQVMATYFDLVQQKRQLNSLDSTLVLSESRVELANNKFSIGKASKLELLNAQVDENTDRTLYFRQQEIFKNTKTRLNELMGRDLKSDYTVLDFIVVDESLQLTILEELAKSQNPQLLAEIINKRIAELELKQIKSGRLPLISAQSGYLFNDSNSSLGFTTNNQARGFNFGIAASLNLFDGLNQSRNEQIAIINVDNSNVIIEQQTQTILSQINTAYNTYLTNLRLMELEVINESIAKENLEITIEKYRIGTIPTLEFRTAQLNYINSVVRSASAVYEAKLSEIKLKELSGSLNLQMPMDN